MARKIKSKKDELLIKSREAMLTAVQIFNNPNIQFKSESFIVLSIIAWTYLLHAFYRSIKIEYRYHKIINIRKRFDKTKKGAYKYWELERCLNDKKSPIDEITSANIKFLIGLRHEIEHQMTTKIDEFISARFQSCCLNFNQYIKKLFGDDYGIDKHLSFSLQFSSINEEQIDQIREFEDLAPNLAAYINAFDSELPEEIYNDTRFSYRVLFVPISVNRKGQADRVIEFISANSPLAEGFNKEIVMYKDREKKKYLPLKIKNIMNSKGYIKFGIHHNTELWKDKDGRNPLKNFGVEVEGKWYWYENWIEEVEKHCKENRDKYC